MANRQLTDGESTDCHVEINYSCQRSSAQLPMCSELYEKIKKDDQDQHAHRTWHDRFDEDIKLIVRAELATCPGDIENATTEVIDHVFLQNSKWNRTSPYCAWVKRIARNKAVDIREGLLEHIGSNADLGNVPQSESTFTPDQMRCIEDALSSFSNEHQFAWWLYFDDGFSQDDIAKIINTRRAVYRDAVRIVQANTIASWFKTMRELLRECIG